MSFDDRDVRHGMDVFTLDNVRVGTIVWIRRSGPRRAARTQATDPVGQVSRVNGESLGPMPTTHLGNRGPLSQGARTRFGSRADPDVRRLEGDELVVLRTPIGLELLSALPRLRRVPMTAVQTVSLERVVLRVTAAGLEAGLT